MDTLKSVVTGGIITLLIGGTAYTFSQQDVVNNFSEDTGLTLEQSEQYINSVSEDHLVPFKEVGTDLITESETTQALANEIDCANSYEWETEILSCAAVRAHVEEMASIERLLGQAYMVLVSDSATKDDMRKAIMYLDQLNASYAADASQLVFDVQGLQDQMKANSYNKALIKAALESE